MIMKPAFVLLFILVATLACTSGNTDEQKPTFELNPNSMTTISASFDDSGAFYQRTLDDSSYYIEDSSGVLAERFNDGSWKIHNTYAAFEAMYKIDSALSKMYNKDSIK